MMQATAIAYPIAGSPTRMNPGTQDIHEVDPNYFAMGGNTFNEDTVDMSSNFFNQLDSMIQAVKVESSALDTMRDKLKEVDNLRTQISAFTKRLLDADQSNLNLKANLVKAQEAYAELKKQKAEVESTMVPLRQELNRTKDMLQKERTARQQLQQELAMVRDQFSQLQKINEQLDREVKTIPAINESNEILKSDLDKLRKRYKEEKAGMQKHIKHMELQSRDVDGIKNEVRNLAMRLMEISATGAQQQQQQSHQAPPQMQQMQQMQMNPGMNSGMNYNGVNIAAGNAINLRGLNTNSTMNAHYDYNSQEEDDDDDYTQEDSALVDNDSDIYDNNSFVDDNSHMMMGMNNSVDSSGSITNGGAMVMGNMNQLSNVGNTGISGTGGVKAKKKKVKKVAGNSGNLNMMQIQGGQGMQPSYSLPRIH